MRYAKNNSCKDAYYKISPKAEQSTPQRVTPVKRGPINFSPDDFPPVSTDTPSPYKTPCKTPKTESSMEENEEVERAKRKLLLVSPRKTRANTRKLQEKEAMNYPMGSTKDATPRIEENDDNEEESLGNNDESQDDTDMPTGIDYTLLHQFEAYCQHSYQHRRGLDADTKAGIKLLALLARKRVPLNVYNAVYQWHLEHLEAKQLIQQTALLEKLKVCYNMENNQPKVLHHLKLPHSQARINLVVQDARYQIQSLLTDPRIHDEDYLFFNDNPFEPPPEEFEYVSDINTGRCYRETYNQLITDPTKQVLLPMIFYMDGAVTGQFDNLPIEALKMTLGIFNQNTRDKAHAWRNIGYITRYVHAKTQAEDLLLSTEHIDAKYYVNSSIVPGNKPNYGSDRSENTDEGDDDSDIEEAEKSSSGQDLHYMLGKFLEPYKKLQDIGALRWNLRYKGVTHEVEFIPFIMFVKGDAVELDKHCGSYTIRTRAVEQLCRYCTCPNNETDNPYKRWPRKSPQLIQNLVEAGDQDGLQALSQQNIQNVWYEYRFGCHNQLGIHGASALDLLHWYNIGKLKNRRIEIFTQMGKTSILGNKINALATSLGYLFARQSDRELPRTMFSKGLKKGKLQGHEMSGLMLILAAVFRTQEGRTTFIQEARGVQKQYFTAEGVAAWRELIEQTLQWEAWLKSKELRVNDVKRSEIKIREIMEKERIIGKRTQGMGYKTFNYHASSHVADDILDFGVPTVVNTSSNESHHKPDKTAAL